MSILVKLFVALVVIYVVTLIILRTGFQKSFKSIDYSVPATSLMGGTWVERESVGVRVFNNRVLNTIPVLLYSPIIISSFKDRTHIPSTVELDHLKLIVSESRRLHPSMYHLQVSTDGSDWNVYINDTASGFISYHANFSGGSVSFIRI